MEENFRKFEDFIFERMSKTHLPGMSVVIIEDGIVIYSRGFGFRDRTYGFRATPNTLYAIGSITKSFTALSIMQLVNEGKLSLDDPVSKYTPLDLKYRGEPVRVWHLLTHSSGIPALAYAEALIRYVTGAGGKWLPMATYEDLFAFMREAGNYALARPGERWFYLNEGYLVLGYIVEKLSGMDYRNYVKKRILEPLGMNRTFFGKEKLEADSDVATPYIVTKEGEHKKSEYLYSLSADGGLLSNATDLARYIIMYLNRGEHNGTTILSPELVAEMEKPRIKRPLQVFGGEAYGYGLGITPDFFGCKLVGHGGSVLVATAYIGYIPERKIGIALLANGSGYPLSQIGMYGLALKLGKNPEELPFIKMDKELNILTGRYETYKGTMEAQVVKKDTFLYIEIKDKYMEMIIPLVPENIQGNVKTFYTLQGGGKLKVEFIVENKNVDLIYERYRLRKIGSL
ncbi:MAG: serine hydrolase [Thermoproteota archaeon]|nr:serine hydrolase [Thermoproteota archaeon]